MKIDITKKETAEIGYFKNFPDKKSKKLYKWKGNFFDFERMKGENNYNTILKNKKKSSNKMCGVDNEGNELYFRENEKCPINYVEISNTVPILPGVTNFESIDIDGDLKLFYTNEYTTERILIDFRISDIKGPYLNKKIMKFVLFI
jgi:hypothetical protein